MINWIKEKCSKGLWSTLAMSIVLMLAGPEIMIGMELMAIVELLGPSTFVIAYFTGVKLWLNKGLRVVAKFESHSTFFIPTIETLKQMPSMVLHAIPERIAALSFISFVTLGMMHAYLGVLL